MPPTDDTDPSGSVEAGLAALLADSGDFEQPATPKGAAMPAAATRKAGPGSRPRPDGPRPAGAPGVQGRPSGARRPPPRRSSLGWRIGFPLAVLVCALVAAVLFSSGWDQVRKMTGGVVVNEAKAPDQPGYEAFTIATPTLLVVQTDTDDQLVGVAVLALTGEGTGGVVVLPPGAVLAIPGVGASRLDDVYTANKVTGVKVSVELLLGVGLSDVAVVSAADWSTLTAPVAPIPLDNPDAIVDDDGRVRFPSGRIELAAADVGAFLAAPDRGETDVNLLLRLHNFWSSWLDEVVVTKTADQLPGESKNGLGHFVRTLAGGRIEVDELPGSPTVDAGRTVFSMDASAASALVAELIPFPVSPQAGTRLRVRLLDGTGRFGNGVDLAPSLVQAGAEVAVIGNAGAFGQATTTFTYADETLAPRVERLRATLGVGTVEKVAAAGQGVDVTIVLGADAADAVERAGHAVLTSPPQSSGTTPGGTSVR